jgi:hypothetical protein
MSTSGPVVETVSRKRVVSATELENEKGSRVPDFWEYVESLKPEQWSDHIIYLYRQEPKTTTFPGAPPAYLDKYTGTIEVRPGITVAMDDAGTIQQAIKEKFGGRVFRMILKKGKERVTEATFSTEAQPKYPDNSPQYANQNPLPGTPATDASVASKAIDAMAAQPLDSVRMAMEVLRGASEIVMRHGAAATPAPAPPVDDFDRQLKQAMIARLLNPPDPFEMLVRFKTLMGDSNGAGGPMMEKILGAAVDKILNPLPPVTGRTTLLDIGREFIPVLGTVMHEYRLSREADARITEVQRSAMPPQPAPVVQQNPSPAPAVLPAPQPAPVPAAAPQAPPAPTLTFPQIEAHIASIISNSEFTTDEAVDEVLAFLYNTDPRLVGALLNPPSLNHQLKPGKEGLMMLCTYEAPFKACLSNPPRLSEFLDKFIAAATQEEANQARLRAAAPANPKPA